MDRLDALKIFVATARTRSFSQGAAQIGISNRLASKYIAQLEDQLGLRLLQRTTRTVGLTPEGEALLDRAPELIDGIEGLLSDLSHTSHDLSGKVRIAAPVTLGELYLAPMLARFSAAHPKLSIDLRLSDRFIDLAAEGVDLAFRIGELDQNTLKARKLGDISAIAVASPDFITDHDAPQIPADLPFFDCIIDTNRKNPRRWAFTKFGRTHMAEVKGRFAVNSARAAAELAIAGCGICYAPRFAVAADVQAGRLQPVMDGFVGMAAPLNAVYLEGRSLPKRIRAIIDFAAADMKRAEVLQGVF